MSNNLGLTNFQAWRPIEAALIDSFRALNIPLSGTGGVTFVIGEKYDAAGEAIDCVFCINCEQLARLLAYELSK